MFQYSFANVDLILEVDFPGNTNPKTFKIKGFATGENLINISRRAPLATVTFAAYGTMIANLQRIRAGDLSFPTLMNSPENKYLQDYANYVQAQADGDGELIQPIQAKMVDNMGKDESTLTNGIILAMPSMVRGQTINSLVWVITFETVTYSRNHGGDADAL